MKFSPTQLKALRTVSNAARVGSVLKLSMKDARKLRRSAIAFVRVNRNTLNGQWFALILMPDGRTGTQTLDGKTLTAHVGAGRSVIWLDRDFRIIKAQNSRANFENIAKETLRRGTVGYLVAGDQYWEFVAGYIRAGGSVSGRTTLAPFKSYARPAAELNDMLTDHFDHCVARERGVRYWHNKSKRILSTGVDGTETIFQHSLITWLHDNVLDKLDVYGEPSQQFGQDKTDVVVVAQSGRYVIEVKWLGINKNHTTWKEKRINEGLVQVNIYMTNNPCIQGFLTVYDARSESEHKQKSRYNKSLMHAQCSLPRIFLLDSSNPSHVAAATAKN